MALRHLIPDAITIDVDVDVSVGIDTDEFDVLAEAVEAHVEDKFERARNGGEPLPPRHDTESSEVR